MNLKLNELSNLAFEPRDIQVFKLSDVKTRTDAVQNYFFPRLDYLLKQTLNLISEIYEVNPFANLTFVHHPDNRRYAETNFEFKEAYAGICGKRTDKPLNIRHEDGTPFYFHPTYLTYQIEMDGSIHVELLLFRQKVDIDYISAISQLIEENLPSLSPIFSLAYISYSEAINLTPMEQAFSAPDIYRLNVKLFSPSYYFPVDVNRGLKELVLGFIALYPIVDTCIAIGKGEMPDIDHLLSKFRNWQLFSQEQKVDSLVATDQPLELPEMDSYNMIRAGLWWDVLADNKWKCRSCGRGVDDGVTLEVDHIIPRSLGGTNDRSNLQALCKKCNIGKSNKNSTDLRKKDATTSDTSTDPL